MFKPGQSENPNGRTPGTGKVNEYRKLLESHLPELVKVLVDQALAGEPAALRMCFERLIPAYRAESMAVNLNIPNGATLADIGKSIITAIPHGDISVEAGSQLMSALTGQARLVEVTELEARIAKLEAVSEKTQE